MEEQSKELQPTERKADKIEIQPRHRYVYPGDDLRRFKACATARSGA
jgi:hypothetical protein